MKLVIPPIKAIIMGRKELKRVNPPAVETRS